MLNRTFNKSKLNYTGNRDINGEKISSYRYGHAVINVSKTSDYLNDNNYIIVSFESPVMCKADSKLAKEIAKFFGLDLTGNYNVEKNVIFGRVAA